MVVAVVVAVCVVGGVGGGVCGGGGGEGGGRGGASPRAHHMAPLSSTCGGVLRSLATAPRVTSAVAAGCAHPHALELGITSMVGGRARHGLVMRAA